MALDRPTDRTVFQNAWVVPDLEAAIERWVDQLGVGPFYVMVQDKLAEVTYRGAPAELSMRVALAQAGPVQVELIEQTSDGPSAYRDSVPAGEMGFHHLCVWTHDIDADTEYFDGLGYPAATLGRSGARFGYFDTRPLLGCMLEVVEYQPRIEALFGAIADAAVDWDGSAPIRSTADL